MKPVDPPSPASHGTTGPTGGPAHEPDAPLLDADLVAELDAALASHPAEPLDAEAQARVTKQLLRRIAAESTPRHLTVAPDASGWRPFGKGLTMKVLHEQDGVMSYLVRLEPGAMLPPHRHPIDEECVVLEGTMCIGDLRLPPGAYHRGLKDVPHDRLWAPDGALIFLRGATPEAALAL
jgi:anti-sigma factor ChrR (cupin superfamily)